MKFAKGVLHFVPLDFENDGYAHLKSKIKPEQTPVEGKHHLPRQMFWLVLFCRKYKQTLARIRPEADGNFTIDKQDKHHHLQPHHLPKVFNWQSFGGWAHPIAMALLETWWKWAVLWCFHALVTPSGFHRMNCEMPSRWCYFNLSLLGVTHGRPSCTSCLVWTYSFFVNWEVSQMVWLQDLGFPKKGSPQLDGLPTAYPTWVKHDVIE